MELNNQSQKAGDSSTQMQATTIVNNYNSIGIDEKRARLICKEEFAVACRELTHEACDIATERVHKLENKLLPKMQQYDKSLEAFADPSFQLTLQKAQLVAAASERENDYDLLSELLLHRTKEGHDRFRRLGITKAIEIVDQVSDEALVALTLAYAFPKFVPTSKKLSDGLNFLNQFYAKMIGQTKLPIDDKWLEHLDLLSVIRLGIKNINSFKKVKDVTPLIFSDFFIEGIKANSPELGTIKDEFVKNGLSLVNFVPHQFRNGYVVLDLPNNIDDCCIIKKLHAGQQFTMPLADNLKDLIRKSANTINKKNIEDKELQDCFMSKWNSYNSLKKIGEWWDVIPCHFTITPVGQALANSYIHGKDSSIPLMY